MSRRAEERELPCPGVRFDPGFPRRVERVSARLSAALEREAAVGSRPHGLGAGEFVGFRPYHAGDDPRHIDWSALARLDRLLVRVSRAERGERWSIVLDASASMGVGPPGKLQRAAECAAGIAALARRSSASVDLHVPRRADGEARDFAFPRHVPLAEILSVLEGLRAKGVLDAEAVTRRGTPWNRADRVFWISDFLSLAPREVLGSKGARRHLHAVCLLAPAEWGDAPAEVSWWDPESDDELVVAVEPETRERYGQEIARLTEGWRVSCARARASFGAWSSAVEFERVLESIFAP